MDPPTQLNTGGFLQPVSATTEQKLVLGLTECASLAPRYRQNSVANVIEKVRLNRLILRPLGSFAAQWRKLGCLRARSEVFASLFL